jgi:hypothetical protein
VSSLPKPSGPKVKSREARSVQTEAWSRMAGWVAGSRVYMRGLAANTGASEGSTPPKVAGETARTRLIGDISRVIREPEIPESARTAGLELIGWLARRMPGESAHSVGVQEARESQQGMRATRRKSR